MLSPLGPALVLAFVLGLAGCTGGASTATAEQGPGLVEILDGGAPGTGRSSDAHRTDAVRDLLAIRARAVLTEDRVSFLRTVDPTADRLQDRQAEIFDNIARIPVGSWRYLVDATRERTLPLGVLAAYGDQLWAPAVQLEYRLDGYDAAPLRREHSYLFVRRGTRWYLADDGLSPGGRHSAGRTGIDADPGEGDAGDAVRSIWQLGPVRMLRRPSLLVLGQADPRFLRSVRTAATDAVPAVSAVWPGRLRVVVLVPDSAEQAAQLISREADLSEMAAVTSGGAPPGVPGSDLEGPASSPNQRIVINPDVFRTLSPSGRQVVLTHEITHVATGKVTTSATPGWLAEGFADYVAHRDTGARPRHVARELAKDVRDGRLPARLPGRGDFTADNPRLAQAYHGSWLACRLIAERAGDRGLVRLYHRLSSATGHPDVVLDAALRDELGIGAEQFERDWRRYLDDHLGDE